MATLQKIRNHGVILIVIVGLAMLAFILGDFLNSGSSFFNRKREYVGVIEGHKVHYTDYQAAQDQMIEVYKIESGRTDLDEETNSQIRNQVWQMMQMDWTLRAAAERIGMDVTPEELSELCIGQNPHQLMMQRRVFWNANGQFDRDNVIRFYQSIMQDDEDNQQDANKAQALNYWMYWENAVRLTHLQEKYMGLIQHLVTANKLDAKYAFNARQTTANVAFAMKPYYTVADSLVTVSDRDIKALYESRKSMYKQTPNRSIDYVVFNVVPSEEDSIQVYNEISAVQEEFRTTEDIAAVTNANSDVMFDGRNFTSTTIPEMYRDFAFNSGAKAGDCTELTYTPADQTFRMARIVKSGYSMPDSVQLKAISADTLHEDQELGWFAEDVLRLQNRQIAEKAFAAKKGDRFTVPMGMGEQEFEVMDIAAATPKVQIAILERKVSASSKTYSAIFNEAKQFVINNNTEDAFRAAAQEMAMPVMPAYNLTPTTEKVAQIKQSRQIVRWANDAKEGQISDVFDCGEQYVVAVLTDIKDGDYRPLSDVQPELMLQARNDKKAEMIMNDIKDAANLEAAAQIMATGVQNAEGVTLADSRFANANEPAVVGKAMSMEVNDIATVKGNQGVYMIQPTQKTPIEGAEFNEQQEIQQLNMFTSYSLMYQVMNLLTDNADITDNRANFQ
ncbi:MAG: SurA N-terminal domain-containing protein [Paludibacteraceae bacterium]|nr:SurA N-terminal domain-containing protein [Paludibacteraceae bacterium]